MGILGLLISYESQHWLGVDGSSFLVVCFVGFFRLENNNLLSKSVAETALQLYFKRHILSACQTVVLSAMCIGTNVVF